MGWMSSKNTTSTQESPEARGARQTAMNFGVHAANQPFQQYAGPWSAAPNADMSWGRNHVASSYNVGQTEFNMARDGAAAATRYQPTTVGAQQTSAGQARSHSGSEFMGQYFNPFLTQVGGNMVNDMDRSRRMQIMADEDKAIAAGAYGGSRHGVADAETSRGYFDTLGSNLTDLYSRGFDTAAGLGMQDAQRHTDVNVGNVDRTLRSDMGNADRRLSADQGNQQAHLGAANVRLGGANALTNVGTARHGAYLDSARAQFGVGSAMQGLEQQRIDRERERFNEWRDYPLRQSQIINAAAAVGAGGNSSTVTQSRSPGLGEIGLTLGAAWLASDKNIKSGRKAAPKGVLAGLKKTPVETWSYDPKKGGPNDGGRTHIGPMAQNVKKNLGIGTGKAMPVVDMIGMNMQATKELAAKVDKIAVQVKRKPAKKGK